MQASINSKSVFFLALIASLLLGAAIGFAAHSVIGGNKGVVVATSKAVSTGSSIGVYLTVANNTSKTTCIVGADIAESVNGNVVVDIHKTVEEEGRVVMLPAGPICLGPGETLEMRQGPGSYHVMIMGDRSAIDKIVEDGTVEIKVLVEQEVAAPLEEP
ncbi:copper chaperone PCu(A)C [Aeropyrum camini]|uniref:Uncharacterized protein conserved in bacteria n=1 Tax=Aeropyrum camini SY1 = JCM 12091 TaxID=1198449 RepID=U3TEU1_9CREN|nr:copper chaperone PCu(A)C [Aeropyrum camini]BAN90550.1 uncharacterized protein conserved in bacteria [Aeropyrum camini SY1 = JCM 12091]